MIIHSVATDSPTQLILRILLIFGLFVAPVGAATVRDKPLSTAIAVKQLSGAELTRDIPVRIEGVVTYYDPDSYLFFVQDSTAGIYVRGGFDQNFRVGDLLRVEGIAKKGRLSNIIDEPVFTRLGRAKLPAPKPLTEAEIMNPSTDCDRVTVQGVLRSVSEEKGRLVYHIGVGNRRVKVTIFTLARSEGVNRIGRTLSITGVHTSLYDGKREMDGMGLLVHSLQAITGEPGGGPAQHALPVVSAKDLENIENGGMAHIQMITDKFVRGNSLIGHDKTGSVTARTSQQVPVKPGTVVDLVGYITRTNGMVLLEDAYFQRIGFGNQLSFDSGAVFSQLRLIDSAAEIRRLSGKEAARGYPVRVRGVITYYDPQEAYCFVQGASEGIFVNTHDQPLDIAAGQLVTISGSTSPGDFAPMIELPKFDVIGIAPMPASKRIPFNSLLSGAEDSQWMQFAGVIRSVSGAGRAVDIEIVPTDSGGTVSHVFLTRAVGQSLPADLEDSEVEIEAVCATRFDPVRRLEGIEFFCPGFQYIKTIGKADPQPFSREITPIASVFQFQPAVTDPHRVHVLGTVTWSDGQRRFYIQDATGGLRVESDDAKVVIGEQIHVAGFRTLQGSMPSVAHAWVQSSGKTAEVTARSISPSAALAGANTFEGELLRLEGRLVESRRLTSGMEFLIENGKTLFYASLVIQNPASVVLPEPGSVVQIEGVAIFTKDAEFQAQGMKVLLRSASDIQVLHRPTLWNVRRMRMALGLLMAFILLALLWVAVLRNRIARHKAILTANLETQRVLEAHIQQAQKMESIGNLAGGVAHDFNNMLMIMLGYASVLKQETLSEEGKEAVEEIESAGTRAADLTRQLLVFSRKQVPETKALDLNDIIQNLTRMLGRLLGEDIALQFEPGPRAMPVEADKGMIEQVLMNLAVNSRDAMPNGGTLCIATENRFLKRGETPDLAADYSGAFICLSVTDTGAGIPAEILPQIFDPFFTTKDIGKGTGLGLATVYGIVKQHHGWINVESKPGTGTRFSLFFPLSKLTPESNESPDTAVHDFSGEGDILLVEDDSSVRRLTRQALERAGYNVLEADSGPAALLLTKDNPAIDLIITDVIMPGGLTGAELAQKLKERYPDIPIMFTSGYSEIRGEPLRLPSNAVFLQKPYPPEVLLKTVQKTLGNSAGRVRNPHPTTLS